MSGTDTAPSWKIEVVVPAAAGDAIAAVLEAHVPAVSQFPAPDGGAMRISGYAAKEPDETALRTEIEKTARDAGIAAPALDIVWLPATDGTRRSDVSADGLHPLADPLR